MTLWTAEENSLNSSLNASLRALLQNRLAKVTPTSFMKHFMNLQPHVNNNKHDVHIWKRSRLVATSHSLVSPLRCLNVKSISRKQYEWMMNNVRVHCNGNLDIILNYYIVDVALCALSQPAHEASLIYIIIQWKSDKTGYLVGTHLSNWLHVGILCLVTSPHICRDTDDLYIQEAWLPRPCLEEVCLLSSLQRMERNCYLILQTCSRLGSSTKIWK